MAKSKHRPKKIVAATSADDEATKEVIPISTTDEDEHLLAEKDMADAVASNKQDDDDDHDDHDNDDEADEVVMENASPRAVGLAKTSKKSKKASDKKDSKVRGGIHRDRNGEDQSSVIYIGHLPSVLGESDLLTLLRQFGGYVHNIRISRSDKTGNSRGYAFCVLDNPKTARIVADTLSGYLLFDRKEHVRKRLVCHVVPPEKVHPGLFLRPKKKGSFSKRQHIKLLESPEAAKAATQLLLKKEQQRRKKLESLGIEYDFPGYANAAKEHMEGSHGKESLDASSKTDIGKDAVMEDVDPVAKMNEPIVAKGSKVKKNPANKNALPDKGAAKELVATPAAKVSKDETTNSSTKKRKQIENDKKEPTAANDESADDDPDKMDVIEPKQDQFEQKSSSKKRKKKKTKKQKSAKTDSETATHESTCKADSSSTLKAASDNDTNNDKSNKGSLSSSSSSTQPMKVGVPSPTSKAHESDPSSKHKKDKKRPATETPNDAVTKSSSGTKTEKEASSSITNSAGEKTSVSVLETPKASDMELASKDMKGNKKTKVVSDKSVKKSITDGKVQTPSATSSKKESSSSSKQETMKVEKSSLSADKFLKASETEHSSNSKQGKTVSSTEENPTPALKEMAKKSGDDGRSKTPGSTKDKKASTPRSTKGKDTASESASALETVKASGTASFSKKKNDDKSSSKFQNDASTKKSGTEGSMKTPSSIQGGMKVSSSPSVIEEGGKGSPMKTPKIGNAEHTTTQKKKDDKKSMSKTPNKLDAVDGFDGNTKSQKGKTKEVEAANNNSTSALKTPKAGENELSTKKTSEKKASATKDTLVVDDTVKKSDNNLKLAIPAKTPKAKDNASKQAASEGQMGKKRKVDEESSVVMKDASAESETKAKKKDKKKKKSKRRKTT